MGTRALRKLREQEWEKQLASSQDEEEEESEEEPIIISKPKNAFDMLNAAEDEDQDEDDQDEPEEQSHQSVPAQSSQQQSSTPKSKKKKKKAKKKHKTDTPQQEESRNASEDEIDKALKELSLKQPAAQDEEPKEQEGVWEREATKHLAIEPKNLDPVNEMRGLFGNIALEDDSRRQQPTRRREQNLQGGVDLQTALSGRYNRASQGKQLGSLAKRRNCFMQGKEEWPLATSGGISMEVLPVTSFDKQYNVMHNQLYKNAQWDFRMAVESGQPEAIIALLQKYPYHIASLLQVSEIAKYQGDHSLSGDLLERALFTFGRSVHSSFPAAMREGVARLDFNKPANRELYLAIWRYLRNLEQRGTWKTAFEWSKILLQLNTLSDPFGVTLMIDQLALRGRQHRQFLELASDSAYGPAWAHLPNICISKSLALLRDQKPKEARQQLALAMHRYPYILSALASAIEVSPIPKSIWGKLPSNDAERLYSELYVTRAKDLWNTPETIGLISEVANTLQYYKSFVDSQPAAATAQISLEEARHVMALEIPALIALLPRQYTNRPTSSTDVLPPPSSEEGVFTQRAPQQGVDGSGQGLIAIGADFIQRALGYWFRPSNATDGQDGQQRSPEEELRAFREAMGPEAAEIPDEILEQMMQIPREAGVDAEGAEEIRRAFEAQNESAIAVAGPMAGGWSYYDTNGERPNGAGAAAGTASDEDMPELESIGASDDRVSEPETPLPIRGPHAATVEEADSEDEAVPSRQRPGRTTGPVLRHADSDDEEEQQAQAWAQMRPRAEPQTAHAPMSAPTPVVATNAEIEDDPQRLQRWLIAAGAEEAKGGNLSTYVRRLKKLRTPQQGWVLNMLRQKGEKDLVQRIEQAL